MTDEMRGGGGGRRQALRCQSMGNQPGHLIKESASSQLDLENEGSHQWGHNSLHLTSDSGQSCGH